MQATAIALFPPLREGDSLDSSEFLRNWEAMPHLKHAELIDGVVYMPSPVYMPHAQAHSTMTAWAYFYKYLTPGCETGSEATWMMGPKDVPQPDIALYILSECGGQSRVERSLGAGAPELIVEISGSSHSRDLGVKLELYRRSGVREYLTVLLQPRQVIWRQLVRGRYREVKPGEDGLLRSVVFPGLWLDQDALWNPKRSVKTAVDLGTNSPEHAAFVKRLAAKL
jgi:Uma2 family endonuclease